MIDQIKLDELKKFLATPRDWNELPLNQYGVVIDD